MFTILATSVAGDADAQFWKKKSKRHSHKYKHEETRDKTDESGSDETVKDQKSSKKDKKKKEKQDRKKKKHDRKAGKKQEKKAKTFKKEVVKKEVTPTESGAAAVAVKKQEKKVVHQAKKGRYRVDVLASLYLDELVKNGKLTFKDKIPDKALPGVAFYAGINIAADSLKKEGVNIDIYVHDIASASETAEKLTTTGALDSTDLIIGAVPPADVPLLADYAKKNSVNFISTSSASDGGVQNNLYFTMMQPSLKSHCEWITEDIKKKFPGQRVSLLYQTKGEAESNAYNYITDAEGIHFKYLACNTVPRRANYDLVVDPDKPNVLIIPMFDISFADSILHGLARCYPGTHFEVYGMPSWLGIEDLRKPGIFPNITVNITTPFILDPSTTTGQYVKHMYKLNYSGKISESVFRGYETMFWYAGLLKKYGTHFSDKYSDNPPAPFTQFDIQPAHDSKNHTLYYENKHIFLSVYEAGVYKVK